MILKQIITGFFMIASLVAGSILASSLTYAQDAKVKTAMEALKSKAGKLGAAKIEGTDSVGGQTCICHLLRVRQAEQ